MKKLVCLILLFLFALAPAWSQVPEPMNKRFRLKGSVKAKESSKPISGVDVSTNSGAYTITNALGEFNIVAAAGDVLIVQSPDFETVRYTIKDDEDIAVLVEGYDGDDKFMGVLKSGSSTSKHKMYLDSALFYKRTDIEKSIDFITQSIAQLGKRGNSAELARSLTALGEVYQYHKQYDLAITSFVDALKANKTIRTALLLGRVYILNGNYDAAEAEFLPLLKIRSMVPYQKVALYEGLGDVYKGQGNIEQSVAYYEEGLKIAKKNQIAPKMADLNSQIADAYAKDNKNIEAEGFYKNSLELASRQAPKRSIQEKEKVADYYNQANRYPEEIQMRKNSLNELKKLSEQKVARAASTSRPDSITTQQINYKIANAYIAQDKLDEAIPYLERSIVEANVDNDLIVRKDATRKLSEVYKYKGEFSKALETYKEYASVVDTLYARKEQELSQAARFNFELSSKQNRIAGLEQERELSQSKYDLALTQQELFQNSNKMQRYVIYSLIIGLILMALAAFFFYRNNKQQKISNNLLALKSLRSQMNPHFIFNALNSVNNYIAKSDERSANRYLSEFSTLMRSVLENSEEDFIPMTKELELLELYVKLEHSRFPEKFDYQINIAEHVDVASFQIPPMLLQPYIENSIWHGLRYKDEKGFLHVDITQKDKDTLKIVIKDNGIGRKKSAALKTKNQKKQKSKGMGNIKKRVAILNDMYKDKVDVYIADLESDGTGTQVTFTLKKD